MFDSTRQPQPLAIVAGDNVLIRMNEADILNDAGYATIDAHYGDHALSSTPVAAPASAVPSA